MIQACAPIPILYLLSSILHPRSSIFDPPFSILYPRSSILNPPSSIFKLLRVFLFVLTDAGNWDRIAVVGSLGDAELLERQR